MNKQIVITDAKGTKYTLEYSRRTAQMMEAQGFVAEDADKMPNTMLPMLFAGAFLMHHRTLPQATIDEIYEGLPGKEDLLGALIELYSETYLSLVQEPEGKEKNCTWTKSW